MAIPTRGTLIAKAQWPALTLAAWKLFGKFSEACRAAGLEVHARACGIGAEWPDAGRSESRTFTPAVVVAISDDDERGSRLDGSARVLRATSVSDRD